MENKTYSYKKLSHFNDMLKMSNEPNKINPYTDKQFEEDLKKILYLKKLLSRYKNNNELRERLILNHIIVLYNIFGEATIKMLFFKIEESCWDSLITFLVYLDRMPETIPEYGIILSDVTLDEYIIANLRKL